MKLVWFIKRKHRETVRRLFCGALVVVYLLVTGAANLFHTEVYNHSNDRSHQRNNSPLSAGCDNLFQQDSGYFTHSSAVCPVCVFLKTHKSQVFHDCILVSLTPPPLLCFQAVEVVLPYKHPLPALQTRAPPA